MIFRTFRLRIILVAALAAAVSACTDNTYDFDRVDHAITLGGEDLALPLAKTGQMTVADLVGDKFSEYIAVEEDGSYAIQYDSAPYSFTFDGLKDYDGTGPFRRYINYPISYGFNFFSKPVPAPAFDEHGEADLTGVLPGTISLGKRSKSASISVPRLPDELVSLASITLSDDSCFELTVSIPDCMFTEGTVIPDLRIDLSAWFESKDAVDGILHFDTPLEPANGYTATQSFNLHKVVFDPKNYDPQTHTLMLKAVMNFDGSCTLQGVKTDRSHYESAPATTQLLASVILRRINCQAVEGVYKYQLDDIQTSVNFKEMMDRLTAAVGDEALSIDLSNPEILLDVATNITIPTKANINLSARKNNIRYASINNILVNFPFAAPGESINSRIRLAATPKHEEGVEEVIVDFSKLMSRIPDDILVDVDASTRTDLPAEVRLGVVYNIDMLPRLRVPLAFGPSTQITLRDTVALPEGMGTLLRDNTLIVTGQMTNTLPLQVDFDIVLIDPAGKALTEPVTQHIDAGGTSAIEIPLKKTAGDDIDRATGAILTFQVTGIRNTRAIKVDDYIEADLKLRIPGGYHLSF